MFEAFGYSKLPCLFSSRRWFALAASFTIYTHMLEKVARISVVSGQDYMHHTRTFTCVYIYIYIITHTHIYIYIHILRRSALANGLDARL